MAMSGLFVGQPCKAKGYVSIVISCVGRSTSQLEDTLGYAPRSLGDGYWFGVLDDTVAVGEFLLRGYSHFSGGKAAVQNQTVHTDLRNDLKGNAVDKQAWKRILMQAEERFAARDERRICKIFPKTKPSGYPPGLGVVQYELTVYKNFQIVAFVNPGQKVVRLAPSGKNILDSYRVEAM
jgi:hypothetical protein